MPNWKKVAVSGSNVAFHHITASGHISGTAASSASFGAISVVGFGGPDKNLAGLSASLASRIGSTEAGNITEITAGTGLSGGGSSGTVTVNVDFSDSTFQSGISGSWQTHLNGAVSNSIQLTTDSSGILISSSAQLATAISGSWQVPLNGAVSSSAQLSTDISGSFTAPSSSFSDRLTTFEPTTGELISSSAQLATAISGSWIGAVSSSAQLSTDISGSFTEASAGLASRIASTEAGNITGITAGTGLSGGGSAGDVTVNVDFSDSTLQSGISGSFVLASSSLASRITTTEAELGNTLISSSAQLATAISGSWIGAISSSAQLKTDISGSWLGWASSSVEHSFGGDIRVSGDIVAENYIVSSSVTYMTQSFSSGSTIFGDSPDDTHVFTGSLIVSSSTGIDVQHGNISGSYTSTGSFGRIEASVLGGLSPIRIESDTFTLDATGGVSGSGESTGSFGRLQADMVAGEMQVTTGSLTGEMWITTNTGSRMFIGKSTKGILVSNDSGSDIDVGQTVDGTDIGFSTVHSTDSGSIYLTTGDGIVIDDQNHWYTDRKFHIGGNSQFIRFDGENNISMSAQMFPQTGSFGGQMWVNTSDADRMYIGKYAGGFTVTGEDSGVEVSRYATDEDGNIIDVGFYMNDSGSIIGISDGDGLKVNDYNYWYTNRQFAIGTGSQYIRYDDNDLFQVKLGNAVFASITSSGNISSSAASTGSFGRVEATTFAGDGAALTNVPDYVFEPDYDLKKLNDLETFVSQSKHLPNVPSIDDMPEWAKYTVGDRDMLLLEKIEELTLYIIELHKRVESLESQLPTNNPTT